MRVDLISWQRITKNSLSNGIRKCDLLEKIDAQTHWDTISKTKEKEKENKNPTSESRKENRVITSKQYG